MILATLIEKHSSQVSSERDPGSYNKALAKTASSAQLEHLATSEHLAVCEMMSSH